MGLGKTLQAIAVSSEASRRTLVVCPSYLKLNWEAEFVKFCKGKTVVWIKDKKQINHPTFSDVVATTDVLVINYEMLQACEYLFQWADTVVADEAHYLKNMEAKRTECFHFYIEKYRPKYLHLLTGTPIKNNVDEFYSLLVLCSYDPTASNGKNILKYYPNIWAFRNRFMKKRTLIIGGRRINQYYGHENVEELKSFLADKYIRRLTSQVLYLPDIVGKMVRIKDEKNKELDEMWETFEENKPGNFSSAKAASAAYKAPYTIKYVKDMLGQGEPVVIFTDHIDSCNMIVEGLKKFGVGVIKGGVSIEKRQKVVEDFQSGKINVVVATIGAGSTGITLTRSKNVVFNDVSWVPGDNWQAMKRIHRIGQAFKCFVHYIIASSIDARIVSKVKTKKKTLEAVL